MSTPANQLEAILQAPTTSRLCLYRLIVISQLVTSKTSTTTVSSHYQQFFKTLHNDNTAITGILICFPSLALHLVEGPRDPLISYLRDLVQNGHILSNPTSQTNSPDKKPSSPLMKNTVSSVLYPHDINLLSPNGTHQSNNSPHITNVGTEGFPKYPIDPSQVPIFTSSRIITICDNIQRSYPFWVSRHVDPNKQPIPFVTSGRLDPSSLTTNTLDPLTVAATELAQINANPTTSIPSGSGMSGESKLLVGSNSESLNHSLVTGENSINYTSGSLTIADAFGELDLDESIINSSARVVSGLIALGMRLVTVSKSDLKLFLDSALSISSDTYLPSLQILTNLVTSSSLMTPDQALAFMDPPTLALEYTVALDDNHIWPMPRRPYLSGIRAISYALEAKTAPSEQGPTGKVDARASIPGINDNGNSTLGATASKIAV